MTCKEIHDQITAYVDDRVDEQAYRAKMQQHIAGCADCREAYELELSTKAVVRSHMAHTPAPESLRAAIADDMDAVSRERAHSTAPVALPVPQEESWLDRVERFFTAPVGVSVAVLLVIVGAYTMLSTGESSVDLKVADTEEPVVDTPKTAGPVNLFNKATSNFRAVMSGNLGVSHQTEDVVDLNRYFHDHGVTYDVAPVAVKATLAGGVISDHGKAKFAHLLYRSGNTIIYLFEVPWAALRSRDVVYVSDNVLQQLDAGKSFWEEPDPSTSVVLFKKGEVVCAMVANVPRSRLQQLVPVG